MFETTVQIEDNLVTQQVIDFIEVEKQCAKLYSEKNHDYGDSFDKGMDNIGLAYGVGRIYDKMNRLVTLTKEQAVVKDESVDDTLMDLACYAIMMLAYRKRQRINIREQIDLD